MIRIRNLAQNILLLLVVMELSAYIICKYLQTKGVFYDSAPTDFIEEYLREREPDSGWPSKKMLTEKYDETGARRSPAYPTPGGACISLYGDSFTFSDYADDEHAWGNLLSRKIGCRVSNYGVSGYGTDQMLLRFEKNTKDEAPLVILTHFSGDIRRNVNRLRDLMADSSKKYPILKPRFILEGDKLKLLPMPEISSASARQLAENPEVVLTNEYFLPFGSSGVIKLGFPFTLSLVRSFTNEHIQAKLEGVPVWAKFYAPNHPSGALELTTRILKEFSDEATARKKRGVILLVANVHDMNYFERTGRWSYDPMIERLRSFGIEPINIGPPMLEKLKGKDKCDFTSEACFGHFNIAGYQIFAEAVYAELASRGLISSIGK